MRTAIMACPRGVPLRRLALALAAVSTLALGQAGAQEPAPTAAADPAATTEEVSRWRRLGRSVIDDYGNFYSARRLGQLGLSLGVAGVLANTDADAEVRDWYQDQTTGGGADGLASAAESFGAKEHVIPAVLVGAIVAGLAGGEDGSSSPAGVWFVSMARAYAVGTPAMLYLQRLTGGRRPDDPEGSDWRPLGEGENGVSGHAFAGAVPFVTLARMSDRRWVKALALGASVLPAWSRLHDDEHFISQVALGWLLAWQATGAVADTDAPPAAGVAIAPLPVADGAGVVVSLRF